MRIKVIEKNRQKFLEEFESQYCFSDLVNYATGLINGVRIKNIANEPLNEHIAESN